MEREGKGAIFLRLLRLLIPALLGDAERSAVQDPEVSVNELIVSQDEGRAGPVSSELLRRALVGLVQLAEDNIDKAVELADRLLEQYVPFANLIP